MSGVKITDLSATSSVADSDIVVVVDVSTDTTKKVTKANLLSGISSGSGGLDSAQVENLFFSKTSGTETVSVGHKALKDDSATGPEIAVGYRALYGAGGTHNIAIGVEAGQRTTGTYMAAVGYRAGYDNTGDHLAAVGYRAAVENTGDKVAGLGYYAAYKNTGERSTFAGYKAGYENTGDTSVGVGTYSLKGNTGFRSTALGDYTGVDNTGTGIVAIGPHALYSNTGSYSVGIGAFAAENATGSYITAIGYQASQFDSGEYVVSMGYQAAVENGGDYVVAIGVYAGKEQTGRKVVGVGKDAAKRNTGEQVIALGDDAACDNTGNQVVALGEDAAEDNTGSWVVGVGKDAAEGNSGDYVVAIGYQAGENGSGNKTIAIGHNAGYQNSGYNVTAIGSHAAYGNNGSGTIAVGYGALDGTPGGNAGNYNVAIGYRSLYENTGNYSLVVSSGSHYGGHRNSKDYYIEISSTESDGRMWFSKDSDWNFGASVTAPEFKFSDGTSMTTAPTGGGSGGGLDSAAVQTMIDADLLGTGTQSTAVGAGASASASYSTAIGFGAQATASTAAIAINDATASGIGSLAIHDNSVASSSYSMAIGVNAEATAGNAIAIGQAAHAKNSFAVAIGNGAVSNGSQGSIALGRSSTANGYQGIALGYEARANTDYSISIGKSAGAQGGTKSGILIGYQTGLYMSNSPSEEGNVFIGRSAGSHSSLMQAENFFNRTVAIGEAAATQTTGETADAIAIGYRAGQVNMGSNSINIGKSAGKTDAGDNSITINATGLEVSRTDQYAVDIRTSDSGSVTYSTDSDWQFGASVTAPAFKFADGTSMTTAPTGGGSGGGLDSAAVISLTGTEVQTSAGALDYTSLDKLRVEGGAIGLSTIDADTLAESLTYSGGTWDLAGNPSGASSQRITHHLWSSSYANAALSAANDVYVGSRYAGTKFSYPAMTSYVTTAAQYGGGFKWDHSGTQALFMTADSADFNGTVKATTFKFADGTSMTTAPTGGGGGLDSAAVLATVGIDSSSISLGALSDPSTYTNTIAIGHKARASGTGSTGNTIAIGFEARTSSNNSTAVGAYTYAKNQSTTAVGVGSTADGQQSTAIGSYCDAENYGFAAGRGSNATGSGGVAIGNTANANGTEIIAIGSNSGAGAGTSNPYGICIGKDAGRKGFLTEAILIGRSAGYANLASQAGAQSIGIGSNAGVGSGSNTISLGEYAGYWNNQGNFANNAIFINASGSTGQVRKIQDHYAIDIRTNDSDGHLWFTKDSDWNFGASVTAPEFKFSDGTSMTTAPTGGGSGAETVYTITGTSYNLSYANGGIQTWTLSGSSTFNPTGISEGESVVVHIVKGANTFAFSGTIAWLDGVEPTLEDTGTNVLYFYKVGTTTFGTFTGNFS